MMASESQQNDTPVICPSSPQNNDSFQYDTECWIYLLYQLPKIISFFGSSDFNFHFLALFLKSPHHLVQKFRIMATKYSQLPFTRLIYFLYEAAPTPDIFIITLFDWVKSKGLLSPWIDHLIQDKSYNKLFTKHIDIYLRQS